MSKLLVGVALASVLVATPVDALPIVGQGALGAFSGELDYKAISSTSATLSLKLVNTSVTSNGGYLTAFVLNNPGDRIGKVTLNAAPSGFGLLALGDEINAAPNGKFDFGVATGNGYEGGGKPQNGLGVGATGLFTFNLTGVNLATLSAAAFFAEFSSGSGSGNGYAATSARFRGFANGGSDKVTGTTPIVTVPPAAPAPAPVPSPTPAPAPSPAPAPVPVPVPVPPITVVDWPVPVPSVGAGTVSGPAVVETGAQVPEPAAFGLLGLGLIALAARRRRSRAIAMA